MSDHQTFLQIRVSKNLSLEAIAAAAQVPVEDVYFFEAGVSYPRAFLENVLQALSMLTGDRYTRENIGGIYALEEEREAYEEEKAGAENQGA